MRKVIDINEYKDKIEQEIKLKNIKLTRAERLEANKSLICDNDDYILEMMLDEKDIRPAMEFINEFVEDETKERFELDDMLYEISMKIFNYRMENDLSKKDLAKKLDVSPAMVSKFESGQYNPSIEQLWKISKKLNLEFTVSLEVR